MFVFFILDRRFTTMNFPLLVFLAFVSSLNDLSTASYQKQECTILNNNYQEFLFAEHTPHKFAKEVFTTPTEWDKIYKLDTNSSNMVYLNANSSKFLWKLEPVYELQSTFYIKNVFYDEYFQALKFSDSIFGQRRSVTTRMMYSKEDSSFMWRFEAKNKTETARKLKEPNTGYLFYMWSVKYNEALYAANYFFKKTKTKRSVFTWHAPPDGKKFYWVLKCLDKSV